MFLAQFADQFAYLADLNRVQAHRGFVENNDGGHMQNGLGNAHPLLIPFGQIANQPLANFRQAASILGIVNRLGNFAAG